MPTFDRTETFNKDFASLDPDDQGRFLTAVEEFVDDLATRGPAGLRGGLRVKRVRGTDRVWEMTWAPDGRATFEYGDEIHPGDPHIVWRRVGTHDIL